MSKYNFAFDVSTLSDYTNENTDIIARAIYNSPTIKSGVEVLPGQKGDFMLNRLDHNIYLQAAACGWTVSGGTAFGQLKVELCSVDYKEALCPKTLEPKWLGQLMAQGSDPESFPFEQYIVDTKSKKLTSEVEYMIWQGNTDTGTGNLSLCQGVKQFLSGSTFSSTYVALASGATIDATNVISKVNYLINGIDERAYELGNLVLYMSSANFRSYVTALINANLYNYAQNVDGTTGELMIPGHNIRVIATSGLRGLNDMYLFPVDNMSIGTDLISETENLDMWYSKDNREIRIAGSFKLGVGFYFPEFVAHNVSALA